MPGRSWKVYVFPPSVGRRQRDREVGHELDALDAADLPEADEPVVGQRQADRVDGVYATARVDEVQRLGKDRRASRHGARVRSSRTAT